MAIPVVFFGIFITASGFMTVMFAAMVPFAAIVPAGFVVFGVLLLIKTLGKVKADRRPACSPARQSWRPVYFGVGWQRRLKLPKCQLLRHV